MSLERPRMVWLILLALTLGSVAVAELLGDRIAVLAVIFGVAVIKAQLVAVHFMETPLALPSWNALYRVWILLVGLGLCFGMAFSG